MRYTPYLAEKWRGRLEMGYAVGNYCTCGLEDPYLQSNIRYLTWGLGLDFQIYKRLWGDAGMNFANILTEADRNYGYNVLAVGLNYKFGKLD